MLIFSLVIADGLADSLAEASDRGMLEGVWLKKELLFVAARGFGEMSDQPGDEPSRRYRKTQATERVFRHHAYRDSDAEKAELSYVVVKPGFRRAKLANEIFSPSDLDGWTNDGSPFTASPIANFSTCALEPHGDSVEAYLLVFFGNGPFYTIAVETVSAEPVLPARVDGLAPTLALRKKKVAVIGVGSGGSGVALSLAAAGVGTLHLFDHDRLSTENVFRHACGIHQVGRSKVLALKDLISDHQLPAHVVGHQTNIVREAAVLWELVRDLDLVVCATDTNQSRQLVNYVCVHTNTPLLLGCAFHNAQIGEVIRVIPGRSACYECTRMFLNGSGALEPFLESDVGAIPYDSQASARSQTGNDTGTRVDVSIISSLVARATIKTLLRQPTDSQEFDLPFDYFTWGTNPLDSFPEPFRFQLPYSVNWMPIGRQEQCPVCGQLGEPNDPAIEQHYSDIMETLSGQDEADAAPKATN